MTVAATLLALVTLGRKQTAAPDQVRDGPCARKKSAKSDDRKAVSVLTERKPLKLASTSRG